MLARSSNLALISTTTTTCFPASAASISASTIGLSPLVRYSVCLMASTRGSAAASSTSRCTVVVGGEDGDVGRHGLRVRHELRVPLLGERQVGDDGEAGEVERPGQPVHRV